MSNNGILKNIFEKNRTSNSDFSLHMKIKELERNFNDYDKKMILNIIDLSKISAKEIMVPRVDVVAIDINSAINDIIKIVCNNGRSRLPVYNDGIDNIVGVLHAKDLLKYLIKRSDFNLSKIIREPYFIPESKIIKDLLIEMREKKIHLAIVVDEYGGMSGIICLEDIIEQIVGEIQDEFDNEADSIIALDENNFIVDARIPIGELNNRLNLNIDNDEIDTLGGFIYMILGRIPAENDRINFKNLLFTIDSIFERKIKKIKIEIKKDTDN